MFFYVSELSIIFMIITIIIIMALYEVHVQSNLESTL